MYSRRGMGDPQALALAARSSLSALHDARATPVAIKQAEASLLEITKVLNPATCLEVVKLLFASLLSPNADDIRAAVRHVAVQLFQNVSEVDTTGARVHRFPQVVMEKTVALLSALALREWPQRWDTFLDSLLADPRRAEASCYVLRVMSEEMHEYPDSIEDVRRQELIHAMALTLPKSLGFVTAAASSFHQNKNYTGLNAALDTLQAFLSWASLHEVFSAGVPEACFILLGDSKTRDPALSALTTLVRRKLYQGGNRPDLKYTIDGVEVESEVKFRDEIFGHVMKFVSISSIQSIAMFSLLPLTGNVPALASMYTQNVDVLKSLDAIDEEEHAFHVAFFTMLSTLGCVNFFQTFLFSKRKGRLSLSPREQHLAASFIELMLCAAASPSPSIRRAVLPFFASGVVTIAKHEADTSSSLGIAYFLVTGYLEAAFLALMTLPRSIDRVTARFEDMDFDEDNNLQKGMNENFVARTSASMRAASKLCPAFACCRGLKRLVQLLSVKPKAQHVNGATPQDFGPAKTMGLVIPDGSPCGWAFGNLDNIAWPVWKRCLEATIIATEVMAVGASSSPLSFPRVEMNHLMRGGFDLVTACMDEVSLLPLKAQAMRIFSPLYMLEPKLLESCFRTLISQGANMSGSSASRFKACLAISTLCRRLGREGLVHLSSFRQPMSMYASQALCSKSFETSNKIFLLEASISTILVSTDVSEQALYLEQLVDPLLKTLESKRVCQILQNPSSLFNFTTSEMSEDVAHICEAFQLVESAMHQGARSNSKAVDSISIPNVLSRSIAPRFVHVVAALVKSLHGMYNNLNFAKDSNTGLQSVLLPTSRKLTVLLNLESKGSFPKDYVVEPGRHGEDESLGSMGEQNSMQILRQYGYETPDPKHSHQREILQNFRKSGYDILRSAIFSGLTKSLAHLETLVSAVTFDCYFLEPIHMEQLTNVVLRPLLSFPIVEADSSFLSFLEKSTLPNLLKILREHIESAKMGEIVNSEASLLDVARDCGRKKLARSAADLISNMYPRPLATGDGAASQTPFSYLPPIFRFPVLQFELMSLWKAICSPGRGTLDSGAARVALNLLVAAVECAPQGEFELYMPLFEASVHTAIVNHGLNEDSPFSCAIGAVLSVIRKWPGETKLAFQRTVLGIQGIDIWVEDCINVIVQSDRKHSKPKKHRVLIVELIGKIAKVMGVDSKPKSKVNALPEKLVTRNPARRRQKASNELEEIVLGDQAIASLFGDGDPL